jgi:hypothetical protein
VIPAEWTPILAALGEKAPVVLGILLGTYLLLISLATGAAIFHPEEGRRADARKVLKRLLPWGRRNESASRVPKKPLPSGGEEPPPAPVASAQETG